LQLLGGIWISQTIPSVIVGLYTRWLNPWALIIGWAAGLVSGFIHSSLRVRRFGTRFLGPPRGPEVAIAKFLRDALAGNEVGVPKLEAMAIDGAATSLPLIQSGNSSKYPSNAKLIKGRVQ
jgi:Na+/proline symporter